MVNPIVSDLFFNHTHAEYDALNFKEATDEQIDAAILADAKDFIGCYGVIGEIGAYTAEELAQDFLKRL